MLVLRGRHRCVRAEVGSSSPGAAGGGARGPFAGVQEPPEANALNRFAVRKTCGVGGASRCRGLCPLQLPTAAPIGKELTFRLINRAQNKT